MCWDTRIRTWKNRTRICCVTITPYPNFPIKTPVLILTLQRYVFLFNPQIFEAFFSNQDSFFSICFLFQPSLSFLTVYLHSKLNISINRLSNLKKQIPNIFYALFFAIMRKLSIFVHCCKYIY